MRRLVAVALAALAVAATAGAAGDRGWRFRADPGVRLVDAVSADALRRTDGSILLYVNRPKGIEAFTSRDGLTFRARSGRMPLGGHPTVVPIDRGLLRMYYSTESSFPVERARLQSAVSRDGLHWFLEGGIRFRDIGFAVMDVVPLPDGRWRLYFNDRRFRGPSRIVSARSSTRGLRFIRERGIRLPAPYVDPAVVRLDSGRWLMAVSTIERGRRQEIFLAESADGLDWNVDRTPLVSVDGANVFDPTLLRLGHDRYRLYYSLSRGKLYQLRSGVLSR